LSKVRRRYAASESNYTPVGIAGSTFAGKKRTVPSLFRQTGSRKVLKLMVPIPNNCNLIQFFNGYDE